MTENPTLKEARDKVRQTDNQAMQRLGSQYVPLFTEADQADRVRETYGAMPHRVYAD